MSLTPVERRADAGLGHFDERVSPLVPAHPVKHSPVG